MPGASAQVDALDIHVTHVNGLPGEVALDPIHPVGPQEVNTRPDPAELEIALGIHPCP